MTGAFFILKGESKKKFFEDLLIHKAFDKFTNDELLNYIRAGIIIPEKLNEIEIIKKRYYSSKYSNESLGITIISTLDCNLDCYYCYENKKNEYISDTTIDNIVNHININYKKYKNITIMWYGGEPLLALDKIIRFYEKLNISLENSNIFSGIVTNGLLLNKDNADILKKYKINNIQITFDGDKEFHNKRRNYKKGNSYEILINNIIENIDRFLFSIRINIDKINYESVKNLLQNFKLLDFHKQKNIYIYLGHLKNYGCNNNCNDFCDNKEFKKCIYDFDKLLIENDFKCISVNKPSLRICGAQTHNGYVINYNGDIYKCWIINEKFQPIGNINTGNLIEKIDIFYDYLSFDPFIDQKCNNCKFLPICLGGCWFNREFGNDNCFYDENYLENKMLAYAELYERE